MTADVGAIVSQFGEYPAGIPYRASGPLRRGQTPPVDPVEHVPDSSDQVAFREWPPANEHPDPVCVPAAPG